MAHICLIEVPEETTELMNKLGFHQQQTISPNIEWNNLKGLSISHHYQDYPRNVDDVLNIIHSTGYNLGVAEQVDSFENALKDLGTKLAHQHKLTLKVPGRADSNLLLQGLLKASCAE